MRIVVLGASGLIGHKLFQMLGVRFDDVHAVLHGSRDRFATAGLFKESNSSEHVDVQDFPVLRKILETRAPDVVLNCAGITKRRPEIDMPLRAISVNALFPHRLAEWAGENNVRIIHFSTDCVFDGTLGNYTEDSDTTGKDAYGKTKALGEIRYDHSLTLRSSFIGRELSVFSELLEWFLAQDGETIKGFTNAYYSGISTPQMARIVGDVIEHHPDLNGLYQLSTVEPISKFDLLTKAKQAFGKNIEIEPDDDFVNKPTLDGSKLRAVYDPAIPSWDDMMTELADDNNFYERLH